MGELTVEEEMRICKRHIVETKIFPSNYRIWIDRMIELRDEAGYS
jgi:hypothetical protein